MTDIENRLRDALRATASTVDDRPRSLPRRRVRPVRSRGWAMPLCAAIAVLALIVGLLGVRHLVRDPDRRLQKVPTMPRFLFASYLGGGGEPSRLEVHDSVTGRLLATRTAAKGTQFKELAVSRDGRSVFIVVKKRSVSTCAIDIVRFSVDGSGKITGPPGRVGLHISGDTTGPGALAITADGRRLAYGVEDCKSDRVPGQMSSGARLGVADTADGSRREWRESQGAADADLAWSERGDKLFFVRSRYDGIPGNEFREVHELREMATAAPSGRVADLSRRIRVIAAPRIFEGVSPKAEGQTVFVVEGVLSSVSGSMDSPAEGNADGRVEVLEISVANGRVVRSMPRRAASFVGDPILKGDATGRFLITSGGLIDLARDGRAIDTRGISGFYDLDW